MPQQLDEAGEKVSTLLLEASGSILVAEVKQLEVRTAQVIEIERASGEIARGLTPARPSLALGTARPDVRASNLARGLARLSNSRPSVATNSRPHCMDA